MYCGMVLEVPHSNDFGYSNTMHKSEACRFTLLDLGQVNLNFFALFLTSNGASQYSVIGQMQWISQYNDNIGRQLFCRGECNKTYGIRPKMPKNDRL